MGWSTQRQGCFSPRCKAPPALPSFPHSSAAVILAHPREGERRTISNGPPNAHRGGNMCGTTHPKGPSFSLPSTSYSRVLARGSSCQRCPARSGTCEGAGFGSVPVESSCRQPHDNKPTSAVNGSDLQLPLNPAVFLCWQRCQD